MNMPSRPIAISLSPNTEPDDIKRAWKTLLCPYVWQNTAVIEEVEKELTELFNYRYAALTSSGRRALYDVLKAFDIGEGDEVIVQAFTCIAVPAPVKWTGAKPVYADIVPETYNIDPEDIKRKITGRTRAVIVQHTFGIPAEINAIKEIAAAHNLVLIEDCAHALGASYKNQPLGTFGHAAILSFGRDKPLSCVFGGAVVSENREIIDKIKKNQAGLPYPPRLWIMQQLLHPIAFSIITPLYFTMSIGKAVLVGLQKLRILSKAVDPEEKQGERPRHFNYKFSPALAALLVNQLHKLKRFTDKRREIAGKYIRQLNLAAPSVNSDAQPSWLRFPIYIKDRDAVFKKAQKERMFLGDWYFSPLAPPDAQLGKFDYLPGNCPRAEEANRSVINLPTYPLLTDEQADLIINFINKENR